MDLNELLREAVKLGILPVVAQLVDRTAIRYNKDYLLKESARAGHLDLVKYFVSHGANVRYLNDVSLQWAASNGHLEMVKYFIDKGCDVRSDNDLALNCAEQYSHTAVVVYLESEIKKQKENKRGCN